jgi:hypothetical protein
MKSLPHVDFTTGQPIVRKANGGARYFQQGQPPKRHFRTAEYSFYLEHSFNETQYIWL